VDEGDVEVGLDGRAVEGSADFQLRNESVAASGEGVGDPGLLPVAPMQGEVALQDGTDMLGRDDVGLRARRRQLAGSRRAQAFRCGTDVGHADVGAPVAQLGLRGVDFLREQGFGEEGERGRQCRSHGGLRGVCHGGLHRVGEAPPWRGNPRLWRGDEDQAVSAYRHQTLRSAFHLNPAAESRRVARRQNAKTAILGGGRRVADSIQSWQ